MYDGHAIGRGVRGLNEVCLLIRIVWDKNGPSQSILPGILPAHH